MRRRDVVALLAVTASTVPWAGLAQTAKVYRVGLLSGGVPVSDTSEDGSVLIRELAQRGFTVGRDLLIERRGAMGRLDQLPRLAQELAAAQVDVIVTLGYPAALAANDAGIPTVAASGIGDPVAIGLVASLARPGGHLTGISDIATDLSAKRLELLNEAVPGLRRVAMLWNMDDLAMTRRYEVSASVAERLGANVLPLGVREPDDFAQAFAAMERDSPDAILLVADTLTILNRKLVFDFAVLHRLPAIYEFASLVRDGGLMSYGPDRTETFERAGALVARILKGDKPADLPFELPTRFTLAVNLKTAKSIGLEVPQSLLVRADEVIE
jgi:putative ABC transport system substrate-binding protein